MIDNLVRAFWNRSLRLVVHFGAGEWPKDSGVHALYGALGFPLKNGGSI
jgi:hypothetical protein